MLLLLYLYNPAVMPVLSWDLTKHSGLERLCNTGQKQVIISFFLHILSTTVDSSERGETLRHPEKGASVCIKLVAFYDVPIQ